MTTFPCHINSIIGHDKKVCNEDAIDFFSVNGVFYICISDGQGSKTRNERAGRIAISEFQKYMTISNPDMSNLPAEIHKSFYMIHRIFAYFRGYESENLSNLTCGLTVIAISSNREGYVAHLGNARASIIRDGRWFRFTEDHTVAYDAFKRGEIKEEEIPLNENRAIMSRYFGQANDTSLCTIMKVDFHINDIIALTTDGVHFYVSNEEIQFIIGNGGSIEEMTSNILQLAEERGGVDDRSCGIVVIR